MRKITFNKQYPAGLSKPQSCVTAAAIPKLVEAHAKEKEAKAREAQQLASVSSREAGEKKEEVENDVALDGSDSVDDVAELAPVLGRCPSTVLRVALGRALIYEGNDLYSDEGMFPFLLRGAHKENLLKIDAFPFSNRTRNRTRTAAEVLLPSQKSEKSF